MIELMKNLGVVDDEGDDEGGDTIGKGKNIGLPTFIEKIYLNCKNLGIPPSIIPLWIKDMLDFYANPNTDFSPKLKTDSLSNVKIPFVSQLSYFIDQKKKQCSYLIGRL